MPKDESFKDFVSDQLTGLEDLVCKRMFGGWGLYGNALFFGIIADGRLYFKTNEEIRLKYTEKGMGPFQPNPKQTLKNYYEVPIEVLEDQIELLKWANESISFQTSTS